MSNPHIQNPATRAAYRTMAFLTSQLEEESLPKSEEGHTDSQALQTPPVLGRFHLHPKTEVWTRSRHSSHQGQLAGSAAVPRNGYWAGSGLDTQCHSCVAQSNSTNPSSCSLEQYFTRASGPDSSPGFTTKHAADA